ncbi:MAG: Nramp family divalent metal transporter [Acidobacteriota bacterium]|nr:Nramp family divalent metal transporter [Acidobacteriota bacterium]
MSEIPALRQADMPERKLGFWQMTGPGAITLGLAIGAGELAVWPWVTAKFGAVMIWAAALGVFLQLWINFEIGRWAVVTGENPYTGYARKSLKFIYYFMMLGFVGFFLPGWARMSGVAFKALIFGPDGPGADWMWTAGTFAVIAVVIFGPKEIYSTIEKAIGGMVIVITVGLVYLALRVGTFDAVAEMGRGLLNFGHIELDDEFTFSRFFGAVVFAGIGGAGNLYYAFYLRDKNIGMGARIPTLANPLRQKEVVEVKTGFTYEDTPENARRFRDWFRFVVQDQVLYFWLLNTFTMFLFMFGALTVLRPQGIVPAEGQFVWDESVMLEGILGTPGRYLFLIIGIAALFSSQLGGVDGGARSWAYQIGVHFKLGKRYTQSQLYLFFVIVIISFGIGATAFLELMNITALGFIFNAALLGGFSMAVYVPLTLYCNLKYLPVSARPKPLNIAMVAIGAATYISFALYTLYDVFLS